VVIPDIAGEGAFRNDRRSRFWRSTSKGAAMAGLLSLTRDGPIDPRGTGPPTFANQCLTN
jgi:hypothetical protein